MALGRPADPVTSKAEKFAPLPARPCRAPRRDWHVENARPHHAVSPHGHGHQQRSGLGDSPGEQVGLRVRAVRVALGMVYGRKVEIYGPVYQSHKIEGTRSA